MKKICFLTSGIVGIFLSGIIGCSHAPNPAINPQLYYQIPNIKIFGITPDYYAGIDGLQNKELIYKLNQIISNYTPVDYKSAKRYMFTRIDNISGTVEGIYSGIKIHTNVIPDDKIMNTEHSWPQSKFASLPGDLREKAKSDILHLFPADSKINSIRGNKPYANISNGQILTGGSKTDKSYFEPRDVVKGDIARAIFYFSVKYNLPVDSKQEAVLKEWNIKDPVDKHEKDRMEMIYTNVQHNRNPFIDMPELISKIADF